MRHLPSGDYLTLKAAWRDLVALAGGPRRASGITRGRESHISEAGSPGADERFPGLDQIADLEAETGAPVVARCLADLAGCDLVSRETPAPKPIGQHFAGIVRDCGGLQAALAEAMADGRIDEGERKQLVAQCAQAMDRLQALRAQLLPVPSVVAGGKLKAE